MSDADDAIDDEREAIRQQKRERLREQLDGDGPDESTAPGEPVHVEGPDHLQRLVTDNDVVLVDYYADWCGPCKMLEPVVESIAADTASVVAKVDIDQHQKLASEAGVRGVPTLVVYTDGQPAERLVGMQQEDKLRSVVERFL